MKEFIFTFASILLAMLNLCGQDHGFDFGHVSKDDLTMTAYVKDTSAAAVVLQEFGEAYIDNYDDHNLIFDYHVKIKILKVEGLRHGDLQIPLQKLGDKKEKVVSVQASSFTLTPQGAVQEVSLKEKDIFEIAVNQYSDVVKFAMPALSVGSIVDVFYRLESPFLYNFRSWKFQSDIPKVISEYWATIPGNYNYHIYLRGFLELTKSESELHEHCYAPDALHQADCARYKYAMIDVPAFSEEEYMTAASNYISSINFELKEIIHFTGRHDKISGDWKDVESELKYHEKFGIQIKRAHAFLDEPLTRDLRDEKSILLRCRKIHSFIKQKIQWNGVYGMFCELGIKKAFESGKGNVADVNLALIAALQYAGIPVEPMILSTRSNGEIHDLFPVISNFNYVIAKVMLGNTVYLLDATDSFLPFGLLPERCLNGKGRVLGATESYWYDIKASQKAKTLSALTLTLNNNGSLTGILQRTYLGYDAAHQRMRAQQATSQMAYVEDLQKDWYGTEINSYHNTNLDSVDAPFIEVFDISLDPEKQGDSNVLFSPFIMERWETNPFHAQKRYYPVNFGAPMEETLLITLTYPTHYELPELPTKVALSLPDKGGRLVFDASTTQNTLTVNFNFVISKSTFDSTEYLYLKELFNRVVDIQNSVFLLKIKK